MLLCDVDRLYAGDQEIFKVYAGSVLVWPCYDCSVEDPEYADEFYDDAVLYIPKVCLAPQLSAEPQIKDAWTNVLLTPGPGYSGVWSVDDDDLTFGFNAPDVPEKYGQIIVEEESLWLSGFGINHSASISFKITIEEIVGLEQDGLLIEANGLQVYLFGYEFFAPSIRARALREGLFFPIETVALHELPVDEEVHVIVTYENLGDFDFERLRIYYDGEIEAEYIV